MTLEDARALATGRTASQGELLRAMLIVGVAILDRLDSLPTGAPVLALRDSPPAEPAPEAPPSPVKPRTRRRRRKSE